MFGGGTSTRRVTLSPSARAIVRTVMPKPWHTMPTAGTPTLSADVMARDTAGEQVPQQAGAAINPSILCSLTTCANERSG